MGGASHSDQGTLVLLLTGRCADVLLLGDSMGPGAPGQLDRRRNWTPERSDLGGPRSGVRRVLRDRPPISARMGMVSTSRTEPHLSSKMLRSRREAAADMGGSVVGPAQVLIDLFRWMGQGGMYGRVFAVR